MQEWRHTNPIRKYLLHGRVPVVLRLGCVTSTTGVLGAKKVLIQESWRAYVERIANSICDFWIQGSQESGAKSDEM